MIRIAHINLSPVLNEKNVQQLRALHNEIETHFHAMEAQDVDKLTYSIFIVPMLIYKILESIRNNMIRFNDDRMVWMLDDFLDAIENELRVMESHVSSGGPISSSLLPRSQSDFPKTKLYFIKINCSKHFFGLKLNITIVFRDFMLGLLPRLPIYKIL